jgi:cytochrome c-type biogenesis protein CcmE
VLKKRKFIIGGVILICALGYLLYLGFGSTTAYYSTVSELLDAGPSIYGQDIRVNGLVVSGSIVSDEFDYEFTIADEEGELAVVYNGVMPDGFEDGADLVVQGKIESDGILYATTILAKCPSKYEPEEPD